ncbi:RNA polymerase subunit sigma-70 [Kitasatospora sp. NPDC058162]|uniref:RNA polymerase subunit sigma-70 n=1 Tax=Kitasatospora sp. NPDC058162 TaxID=3346362 RepID=UPI0036DE878B
MDESLVDAVRASDQGAFSRLAEPYRHELQVHCYRMLGSVEDAEDAVQETYLRAWARLDSFAGRAPFRAWLYGIATHACLDALRRRRARVWSTDVSGPADPRGAPAPPLDVPWLQPYPDRLLAAPAPPDAEPEAVVTAKETIELAFLAAIQRLPARQRAVLILRDVLDWSAKSTAASMGMTQAAVNSALQRAHATLAEHLPPDRADWTSAPSADEKALLGKLIAAWEQADTTALVGLLRADARFVMPPRPTWYAGRDDIEVFFRDHVFGELGTDWLLLPTAANHQPAFAMYRRAPGRPAHERFGIGVLRVEDGAVTEIATFRQPEVFASFALPATLRRRADGSVRDRRGDG